MQITLHNPVFNFHQAPPAMASALFASLLSEAEQAPVPQPGIGRPALGEIWADQGGIYLGDFETAGGPRYGLIASTELDIGKARWAQDGTRNTSEWDGLANTAALREDCPAAKLAAGYARDGHSDFYLPARRELQFAAVTVPEKFGTESWYWSSTARGDSYAWAVDFEDGNTNIYYRDNEFRVRPFRRFIY